MKPEEARRLLHAYVDGELDPASSLELEAALAADAGLRASHERLRAMSEAIRAKADYHAAPAALAARIAASLPKEKSPAPAASRTPRWLAPAAALAGAAFFSFAVLLFFNANSQTERLTAEVLASHARATFGGRMIDVASSDQHTVKPWLSARLPFSPPVADFSAEGFPLAGGRIDYVDGRPVAVLVYRRRQHSIEAFVWPEGKSGEHRAAKDGLNLESFQRGGMTWWLVSDIPAEELAELGRRLGSSPGS